MLDERLLITIAKIGEQIENVNELDCDTINSIASNIPEWQEYSDGYHEDFLFSEEIYDNSTWLNEENKVVFTLKDDSKWMYIRTTYNCILHSRWDYNNEIGTKVFKSLDNDNLYKCADCGAFLKSCADIKDKYYPSCNEWLLFPTEWTNEGIITWCKKREDKQQEYETERERRNEGRRQDYLNSIDRDCATCIHMRNNKCEYSDHEDECDDWEER